MMAAAVPDDAQTEHTTCPLQTSNESYPFGREQNESASEDDAIIWTTTGDLDDASSPPPEKLGVWPLAVLVFYGVSGGPFGVEEAIRSAGNFITLTGFLICPLVWSVQEAAVTAELGSAFPEASGGVAWVESAFGSLAGWLAGYLGWISGATDNAIYPVLFLDYLLEIMVQTGSEDSDEGTLHPVMRFLLLACTSILLSYINWLGLPLVGKMSIVICFISMSPFIILTIIGAFKCDPSRWFELPQADDNSSAGGSSMVWSTVMWRPLLNNLFWNLNSFDSVASIAADVEDPGRVFPAAMFWALLLVVAGYFIPLLVAIGASDVPQQAWENGYLARVASDIVGPWLGAWTVFAAGISNIALFQAELSADSFQIMGMAERGFLPKIFSHRSRHGTPTYGIILGTAVIVAMGSSNLDTLIEMLNFNYGIALLLEYAAFLKLRIYYPDLPRPWRVPLGTWGCALALLPTVIMILVVMGLATKMTYLFSIATNLVGIFVYLAKDRGWYSCVCCKNYSPVAGRARDTSPDSASYAIANDENTRRRSRMSDYRDDDDTLFHEDLDEPNALNSSFEMK